MTGLKVRQARLGPARVAGYLGIEGRSRSIEQRIPMETRARVSSSLPTAESQVDRRRGSPPISHRSLGKMRKPLSVRSFVNVWYFPEVKLDSVRKLKFSCWSNASIRNSCTFSDRSTTLPDYSSPPDLVQGAGGSDVSSHSEPGHSGGEVAAWSVWKPYSIQVLPSPLCADTGKTMTLG